MNLSELEGAVAVVDSPSRGRPTERRGGGPGVANTRLTAASLAALAVGLGSGIALHGSTSPAVHAVEAILVPVGSLWVRVLNLLVLPLIVGLSAVAVLDTPKIGALGARSIGLFAAMLAGCAAMVCVVAPPLVALYDADAEAMAALRRATLVPAGVRVFDAGGGMSAWLLRYLPQSIESVVRGAWVLVVLLSAVAAALLVRRFARSRLASVRRVVDAAAHAMHRIVGWLLIVAPVGILALSFGFGLHGGGYAAGFMVAAVLIVPGVLLLFTALLYPVTAVLARIPMRRFARAAAPAQLVAASTQSSLASLPALMAGAREQLALPAAAVGFVLPLAVSVFKVNRTISGPTQLMLLTHAFGVPLEPVPLLLFLCASFLQSFFTPGIPGGSSPYFTLPLYVAAGAPVEGVVILATLDPVLDVFKTLTNVTGDLSAAAILTNRADEGSRR